MRCKKRMIAFTTVVTIITITLLSYGVSKATAMNISMDKVGIQILATSDMHGRFLPYDYALNEESTLGSAAQVASVIKELRNENTLVVDAGDTIQDNSAEIFLDDEVHPMMAAMNEIGYDVWTLGNHEFNYGMERLQKIIKQNKAKVLCGNVYSPKGEKLGADYEIVEKGGLKVGIIGMVTPNITRWDAVNLKGWNVTDPVEETKKTIEKIKNKVDVIIAVEHMDVENEYGVKNSGVKDLANECPELDLIVAAHGHQAITDTEINGVSIVENKNSGSTLAQINLEIQKDDNWVVTSCKTNIIDVSKYKADENMVKELQEYHKKALEDANKEIGKLEGSNLAPDNEIKDIPSAQIQDTALIDLINEVQMHYTGADISASALFVPTANLKEGIIKKCDMALIYKYTNTLYKLEITGKQLKKYMEWSASYYNEFKDRDLTISFDPNIRAYNYDMFSGVKYDIDISEKVGNRIKNLTKMDGTLINDTDVFTLAVNNYRANSHLTTYGSIFEEGEELPKILEIDVRGDIGGVRELIGDYIANVKAGLITAEVDNNWRIIGNSWDNMLHKKAVEQINSGLITIPTSEDGRTLNIKSITIDDLK